MSDNPLRDREWFKIRHPDDPSRTYDLCSYEKFQEIYEPQGYTIVSGINRAGVKERIAELEAQRAALAKTEDNDDAGTSDDATTEQDEEGSAKLVTRLLHGKATHKNN
jgi:hypothetical protein